MGTYLGYYFYKTDGSNTVGIEGRLDEEKLATHRCVQAITQSRKESTRLSRDVLARLGLPNLCEPVSINDLLQQVVQAIPCLRASRNHSGQFAVLSCRGIGADAGPAAKHTDFSADSVSERFENTNVSTKPLSSRSDRCRACTTSGRFASAILDDASVDDR